jgi:POT family proton-dependent oligopeptide transporter
MGMTYDQQRPGQLQLRSSAFLWFYFAINFGALISTAAMPYLRSQYGYAIAFQFPAWLMVVSLAIFASGKKFYAKETIHHESSTPEEKHEKWATVLRLFGIFGLVVLFWIPYEHNDGIWVFFAKDYLNLRLPFTSIEFAPDQIQVINPLCVIIFAPLFGWLFPLIDPKARIFTVHTKILLGLIIGAAASGLMTIAGYLATPESKISVMWLINAYILLTIGEVLVYGTGLELAFAEAPASMKGFITGCFLLTSTIANFFNSFWVQRYGGALEDIGKPGLLSPGPFFGLSGLFTVAAVVLMLVMMPKKKTVEATTE